MHYVSTRRRLLEQAVQASPEGPWQFDFILTPEEFSRLYGAGAATLYHETVRRKPVFPVLLWSVILLLVLALAGPRVFKRLFKHSHRNISYHSFVHVRNSIIRNNTVNA